MFRLFLIWGMASDSVLVYMKFMAKLEKKLLHLSIGQLVTVSKRVSFFQICFHINLESCQVCQAAFCIFQVYIYYSFKKHCFHSKFLVFHNFCILDTWFCSVHKIQTTTCSRHLILSPGAIMTVVNTPANMPALNNWG